MVCGAVGTVGWFELWDVLEMFLVELSMTNFARGQSYCAEAGEPNCNSKLQMLTVF